MASLLPLKHGKITAPVMLLQGTVFVFDLLLWGCCRLHGHEDCKSLVSFTKCFWDSCLLWNIACWADLFSFSEAGLVLLWCIRWASCNWLMHSWGLQRKAEEINYVWVIDDCPRKMIHWVTCCWVILNGVCRVLIRSQGRKSLLVLINDSSDGMGGGRGGTESSSVCAGCSPEGELSL